MADFGLADGQGYMLDRSHAAACRLNLQFYLWKDAIGFNIHPSILISEKCIIADVAAGTGAWLLDVARTFPNATLDGFDNDLSQAPHQKWLPPNISMRHWDIFEDVPEDLVAKYDFIHVRLLVMVIEGNPEPVIRNLLKMLKPGGYLQWDELDCVNMRVKKVDPELQASSLDQLREMSYANGRYNWTLQLPKFMTDQGFLMAFNEQHLLTMEEFALRLMKIGQKEAAAKFYDLIRDGYQESITGAALCIPRIVCVGRKGI
ncbi:S-adenosyl-L-methionine-dependent methyltransferase [Halenospora varia]|nr:S-adenosyl-L-methionine-dependent methyltransferase [Halenospora varia]